MCPVRSHRWLFATSKSVPTRSTIGGRGQVRSSKKATSGSRLDAKTRPMSAPPGGFQRRSSYSNHRTPPMLVPSLEGIPITSLSLAELEACATLTRTFESELPLGTSNGHTPLLGQSRSVGIITDGRGISPNNRDYKRAHTRDIRPTVGPTNHAKKSKIPQQLDMLFDHLQRLGPATTCARQEPHGASLGTASSTALMMTSTGTDTIRRSTSMVSRAVDDSNIVARHRPGSAGAGRPRAHQDLDRCRVALAEHLAARKRESELGRSDVSIRYVRCIRTYLPV